MSEWPIARISEIAKKITIGPFGSRMKSDCYVPDGVPVIRGTNLTGGKTFSGNWVFVSEQTADTLGNCCVSAGDLVFPHRGSIGEVGIVTDEFPRYVMSSSLMKLTCDLSKAEPIYVYYFFKSKQGRHELLKNASQVGTPGIGQPLSSLKSIEIPLPPLPDQRAIARILGDLDDKIELNRQISQTLEQTAQAIFMSWFVDFEPVKAKIGAKAEGRDPERAAMCAISGKTDAELDQLPSGQRQQLAATAALFSDEFVESELGLIPEGWSSISLYDSATFINGAAFNTKDFSLKQEGLPIVKIAELKSGISDQTKFTESTFPQKYQIDNHDVLYSWSGSPNTSLEVFKWFGGKGWLNQHIFKVVTKAVAAKYFVFYLLCLLKPRLVAIATDKQTTGLGHVTVADMKRLKIPYPDKDLLNAFGCIVSPIYEEGSQIEIQSYTLRNIRDELLPVLLSGGFANPTTTVSARDAK